MTIRTYMVLGLAVPLAVWSGCCAHRFERPAMLEAGPLPLLEKVRQRQAGVRSFEYLARMSYYGDAGARKGKVEVVGRSPDHLRFEALTPTDDTLAVLASNGTRFVSHERGQRTCHVGASCAANVSRLLPIAFEAADLYAILSGGAPVILHDESEGRFDECEGVYVLRLHRKADDTWEEIWLRPDTFGPVRVRATRGGQKLFEVEYADFQETGGVLLPRVLRFESPQGDTDLKMEIREAYLNQPKDSSLFEPVCPAGTEEEELPCE